MDHIFKMLDDITKVLFCNQPFAEVPVFPINAEKHCIVIYVFHIAECIVDTPRTFHALKDSYYNN